MAPITARGLKTLKPVRAVRTSRKALTTVAAIGDPASITISACTAGSLFLGRFAFLDLQRDRVAKQGLPVQNGVTHLEAGDKRSVEFEGLFATNDPAGFNLVDLLMWGSVGHAVGFLVLAVGSFKAASGYDFSMY